MDFLFLMGRNIKAVKKDLPRRHQDTKKKGIEIFGWWFTMKKVKSGLRFPVNGEEKIMNGLLL